MAHHFDIKQLEAIVHDENYPVLHWMKKVNATRQLRGDSRYWVFHTPLGDDWLKDGSARDSLRRAACGDGSVDEECLEELRRTIRSEGEREESVVDLHHSPIAAGRETSDHVDLAGVKEKRGAPSVSFVSSFEDELDIGELFSFVCLSILHVVA